VPALPTGRSAPPRCVGRPICASGSCGRRSNEGLVGFADALAAARAISHDYARPRLAALAPHLPETLLADALAAARGISDARAARRARLADLSGNQLLPRRGPCGDPGTREDDCGRYVVGVRPRPVDALVLGMFVTLFWSCRSGRAESSWRPEGNKDERRNTSPSRPGPDFAKRLDRRRARCRTPLEPKNPGLR
jgi:hypothetical protein